MLFDWILWITSTTGDTKIYEDALNVQSHSRADKGKKNPPNITNWKKHQNCQFFLIHSFVRNYSGARKLIKRLADMATARNVVYNFIRYKFRILLFERLKFIFVFLFSNCPVKKYNNLFNNNIKQVDIFSVSDLYKGHLLVLPCT